MKELPHVRLGENGNRGADSHKRSAPLSPCSRLDRSHSAIHEPAFYYFAYGSCMCPVDLKRTLGEKTYPYVIGSAVLRGYRPGFYHYSTLRCCGALDVVKDSDGTVEGVLYQLPWRLSQRLDEREGVHQGLYRHEQVEIHSQGRVYRNVRTYVVINKLPEEFPPNDWYFSVVMRGAVTCRLSEEYRWKLFHHMHQLQQYPPRIDIRA